MVVLTEHVKIASGNEWGEDAVLVHLTLAGMEVSEAREVFYLVEQQFSMQAENLSCKAEWSIRFSEVTGNPEDFQFDIDELRSIAIDEVIAMWRNGYI